MMPRPSPSIGAIASAHKHLKRFLRGRAPRMLARRKLTKLEAAPVSPIRRGLQVCGEGGDFARLAPGAFRWSSATPFASMKSASMGLVRPVAVSVARKPLSFCRLS